MYGCYLGLKQASDMLQTKQPQPTGEKSCAFLQGKLTRSNPVQSEDWVSQKLQADLLFVAVTVVELEDTNDTKLTAQETPMKHYFCSRSRSKHKAAGKLITDNNGLFFGFEHALRVHILSGDLLVFCTTTFKWSCSITFKSQTENYK